MEVVFEDIWGLNAASWISFLKDFKSGSKYLEQAKLFLHYHIGQTCSSTEDKTSRESMHASVISYFDYLHDLKSEKKGKEHEARFAPTTLRSTFAMLKRFFLHTGRGQLEVDVPIIESNLSKWDKKHTVKQAKTFSKAQMGKKSLHVFILILII